jgi:hypothetical protein
MDAPATEKTEVDTFSSPDILLERDTEFPVQA